MKQLYQNNNHQKFFFKVHVTCWPYGLSRSKKSDLDFLALIMEVIIDSDSCNHYPLFNFSRSPRAFHFSSPKFSRISTTLLFTVFTSCHILKCWNLTHASSQRDPLKFFSSLRQKKIRQNFPQTIALDRWALPQQLWAVLGLFLSSRQLL